MSRRRDMIVNTLIGTFLLSTFFACFAAIALGVWLGFIGMQWGVQRLLPGLTVPAWFWISGIWLLLLLRSGLRHVRERRWRNAFLNFIGAPLLLLAWYTPIQSPLGGDGSPLFFWVPVMMVITIADDAKLSRLGFFLAAAVAAASVSVNAGFLGNGVLSHRVASGVIAVAFGWWMVQIRGAYKDIHSRSFPPAGISTHPSV